MIQPMDMIKVRIQLGGVGTNPIAVGAKIIQSERRPSFIPSCFLANSPLSSAADGIGGLYKGLSAGILRQVFYGELFAREKRVALCV